LPELLKGWGGNFKLIFPRPTNNGGLLIIQKK